jgi:hypothetical protein
MLYGTDMVIEAQLGTTTVDLSGSSNSCTINMEIVVGEAYVFNDKWPARVMTAKNCVIDLAAWYSSASDEALDYFRDWWAEAAPAPRTLTFYIPSKTVGADKISGKFVFNGLNAAVKTAETQPIPITTQLMNSGAITWTAYST